MTPIKGEELFDVCDREICLKEYCISHSTPGLPSSDENENLP